MRTSVIKFLAGAYKLLLQATSGTYSADKTLSIDGSWTTGQVPQISTSDSTRLGWVSPSNLNYNPPVVMAYRNANVSLSLTTLTFTTVPYDTTSVDSASQFSTSTSIFTCASGASGYYMVDAFVTLSSISSPQRYLLSIFKNGSEASRVMDSTFATGTFPVLGGATILYLAAGDTVSARLYNGGSTGTFTILGGQPFTRINLIKLAGV